MPEMQFLFVTPEEAGHRLGVTQNNHLAPLNNLPWTIVPIEGGMASGKTSLMIILPCFDGLYRFVVIETSLTSFMQAATVLAGKYEAELGEIGWAKPSPEFKKILTKIYRKALREEVPNMSEGMADKLANKIIEAMADPKKYLDD